MWVEWQSGAVAGLERVWVKVRVQVQVRELELELVQVQVRELELELELVQVELGHWDFLLKVGLFSQRIWETPDNRFGKTR